MCLGRKSNLSSVQKADLQAEVNCLCIGTITGAIHCNKTVNFVKLSTCQFVNLESVILEFCNFVNVT